MDIKDIKFGNGILDQIVQKYIVIGENTICEESMLEKSKEEEIIKEIKK